MKKLKVGVLALQGAFKEHIKALKKLGVEGIEVRVPEQLIGLDGLIIPGGESTTISKLVEKYGFMKALKELNKKKVPIFGTCAGLILLAKKINGNSRGMGFIDIEVERNAYGRQIDSFEGYLEFLFNGNYGGKGEKFKSIFIRAPRIKKVGKDVTILGSLNNEAVLARNKNVLVSAFHPELTEDLRVHKYFIDMILSEKERI